MGLILATIVLLLCQIALGWVFMLAGINDNRILMCFLHAFIMYGLIEEATKFGCARLALRKHEALKKIDIMLVFGFVGMGYEIAETMIMGNLIAGIGRGVFVAHIMYQFIMGHFFYESVHAKSMGDKAGATKNMILSLAVPTLIHGINDLFCELLPIFSENVTNIGQDDVPVSLVMPFLICFVMIIVTNVVGLFFGLKLAKKDPDVEVKWNY